MTVHPQHQPTISNVLTLCSKGGFGSSADMAPQGMEPGFGTVVVPSGACKSFNFGKTGPRSIAIHGPGGQYIGSTIYDGRAGLNIATVDGPSFYSF